MLKVLLVFGYLFCSVFCACPPYNLSVNSSCDSCAAVAGYRLKCRAWNNATCEPCTAGKYSILNGTINTCVSCPNGTYSTAGTTACLECPQYMYPNMYKSGCVTCGSFGGVSLQCTSWRSAACQVCRAGKYAVANVSANGCVACPVGTFSNTTGSAVCLACPQGTYANTTGLTTCSASGISCQPGAYFVLNSTFNGCVNCSAGTYSSAAGFTTCLTCPVLTYALVPGSTACLQCQPSCSAGFYKLNCGNYSAGVCTACTNVI
jgi:hypothetical protein